MVRPPLIGRHRGPADSRGAERGSGQPALDSRRHPGRAPRRTHQRTLDSRLPTTRPSTGARVAILPTLRGPADLRSVSNRDLAALAAEVRETIIGTVAVTGGHLGSSLGVVEL